MNPYGDGEAAVVKKTDTRDQPVFSLLTLFFPEKQILEKNKSKHRRLTTVKKTDTRDRQAFSQIGLRHGSAPALGEFRLAKRGSGRARGSGRVALEGGRVGWLGSTQLCPRIPSRSSCAPVETRGNTLSSFLFDAGSRQLPRPPAAVHPRPSRSALTLRGNRNAGQGRTRSIKDSGNAAPIGNRGDRMSAGSATLAGVSKMCKENRHWHSVTVLAVTAYERARLRKTSWRCAAADAAAAATLVRRW
jgi:hypothetical protein